jgi:hypothetical protein
MSLSRRTGSFNCCGSKAVFFDAFGRMCIPAALASACSLRLLSCSALKLTSAFVDCYFQKMAGAVPTWFSCPQQSDSSGRSIPSLTNECD